MKEDLIYPDKQQVTYSNYLKVNELLDLQHVLSDPEQHDETLFIIIHQVYELWFKQILHEMTLAHQKLSMQELMPFIRTVRRVTTIQNVLTSQVDILETMTPVDFNRFRERLNPASGFQSYQFRLVEFFLGSKDFRYIKFHQNDPKATAELTEAYNNPTFYDEFLRHLNIRGFKIPDEVLNRDFTQTHQTNEDVTQTILTIYRDSKDYYDIYLAMEAMIDLDQRFLIWRYRHIAMVERMIGTRKGTGGSSGVKYLSQTLSKRFFPELWEARNHMGVGY